MPTLTERIETDYKQALKAGQRLRVDTLRLIKAAMQRVAMERRKDTLDDPEIVQVLANQVKQRRETLESAQKSGRMDVVNQTNEELAIVESYLPPRLSPDAVKPLIEEAFKAVGPNQGQIMKHVMGRVQGQVDGQVVARLVAERLKAGA